MQAEIQKLSDERESFIRGVLTKRQMNAGLGDAMRSAIREQAKAKGFTCDGCWSGGSVREIRCVRSRRAG